MAKPFVRRHFFTASLVVATSGLGGFGYFVAYPLHHPETFEAAIKVQKSMKEGRGRGVIAVTTEAEHESYNQYFHEAFNKYALPGLALYGIGIVGMMRTLHSSLENDQEEESGFPPAAKPARLKI